MTQVLISVIVPAYNIAQYLARSLDSILAQTYSKLQIIIVNDGSVDETGGIADSYASRDSRIVVIHKENEGVSAARNVGIDKTRGDYIGFVDGDDTIEPDMFEFLLTNAIKYDADISHCGHTMVTEEGNVPHYGTDTIKLQDTETGLLDLLEGTLVDPGLCTKIYKRQLFDGLRLVRGLRINEDLLINYYLFKRARCSFFADVSKYNYLKRPGSASTASIAPHKLRDPLRAAKEIMENAVEDSEIKEEAASEPVLAVRAEYRYLMTLLSSAKRLALTETPTLTETKQEILSELCSYRKRYFINNLVPWRYRFIVELILRWPFGFRAIYLTYTSYIKRHEK